MLAPVWVTGAIIAVTVTTINIPAFLLLLWLPL